MRETHRKIILNRKNLAGYYKAIRKYREYSFIMNHVLATKKMICDDKLAENFIKRAITTVDGEDESQYCICSARKIIYKTEQKIYSPFVKVACGNLVLWKKVSGKMEVGEFAYCNICSKMEKIIDVY